jgi:hypothetical protein
MAPLLLLRAALLLLLGAANAQEIGDPTAAECRLDNLADRMTTIEDVCCTEATQCVDGPPTNADPCSLACASSFAPLYDECQDGLAAMGVELDGFYASCLESLYKPGQCGNACTPATLNCRLAELNQACCSVPGACTGGSLVPQECTVECALIAVPFEAECTPLLGLDATQSASLRTFAHDTCTDQDLTEIVEYGFDLFSQGCTIEFGAAPPQAGGWVQLTPAQIASASCSLVAGSEAHVVLDPSGRMDFVNFQEDADHSGVLRCDIEMPTPFTKVRGSYVVNPVVPPSATPDGGHHNPGDPTDPDNNYEIVNWGDDPPGHAGSFVFGTEHDIVDRGSQMGTNTASFADQPATITIPETVVTRSSIVRFEMCQSANHEDFSLEQISMQVFADAGPATGNLVVGGSFEEPVCQGWNYNGVCSTAPGSAVDRSPPGWTVVSGDVDWGTYQVEGHCQADCAYEGVQMLDTCGGTAGRVEQVVAGTTAGQEYVLTYQLNAHQGCGGNEKRMNTYVDGALLAEETFKRSGNWADHQQQWQTKGYTVVAAGPTVTLAFESISDSCGCMLLDDVQLIPAADAWYVPAPTNPGGGHRRAQDFFSSSVAYSAACVWDEIDDRLLEIDSICCAHDACDGLSAPQQCPPLCSIAFHGFMAECGTTVASLSNAQELETFEQTCLSAGTVNIPLFIDALSHAECCSSRNCGGCVDSDQCHAVGSGDNTGATQQCLWSGAPRTSLGALVSEGRPAIQSSTRVGSGGNVASSAVDGDTNGEWNGGSCTHTADAGAWWQVNLGSSMPINHIDIYHRTDCCQDRAVGARVIVSNTADFHTGMACEVLDEAGATPEQVQCNGIQGQYVTVDLSDKPDGTHPPLTLCEVKVYAESASAYGREGQTKCDATRHYYEFVDAGHFITWADAREAAAERGGYLATITSAEEQSCLTEIALQAPEVQGNRGCGWLGGNDIDDEGVWEWITGEPWGYSNWSPGEPNDGTYSDDIENENFLAMNWPGFEAGTWVDHDGGGGDGQGTVQNQHGYYVEYEDPALTGCVSLDRMYPVYGIDGGGWTLVRRVRAGPSWHPATDHLDGSEPAYGTFSADPTVDETFGVPFANMDFDQFMFATGDAQIWLITEKEQVQEIFGYAPRQILMSSTNPGPCEFRSPAAAIVTLAVYACCLLLTPLACTRL